MKRSRVWLMLALLLAIALVTSGCFQIRMFKLNKRSLAAGEMVNVRVETYPMSMSQTDTQHGYFVLLIGMKNISWHGASQVDVDGNWGGPYNKGNNTALVNLLRAGGNCASNGLDAADVTNYTWRVVVSDTEFGVDGPTPAQLGLRNRVQLYFDAPAYAEAGDKGDLIIFSGVWDDDLGGSFGTHGVPDAGEAVCTGMIATSVPYTD
ncbi:MAG: hypothetical protein ABIJ48_06125 [Actinomycetota bacterium]